MPFEEIAHTADWALRVWADSLPELFAEAARGMNTLAGIKTAGERVQRTFETRAPDAESLLVAFLSELVYATDQEGLAFEHFEIALAGDTIKVDMGGARLAEMAKVIKAVTYHNLQIKQTGRGFQVEIVFDV